VFFWLCKASRGFWEENPACGFESVLEILHVCDSWSLEAYWETFCNAKSNSGDFKRVSTQCWILYVCIWDCFVASLSSSTIASYQDLIGFADKMAKAMNFKEGFGLSGFVGWIYGAFPLSFFRVFGGIRTCFKGILRLGSQGWNLNIL
jgi:hypothetical protein